VTDEEILGLAFGIEDFEHMMQDEHLIAFARLIAAKQREIDAALCEKIDYACTDAIRSQK